MRSLALAAVLIVSLSASACTTGSAVDALKVPPPSSETTSSVVRPGVPLGARATAPTQDAVVALTEEQEAEIAAVTPAALVAQPKMVMPDPRPETARAPRWDGKVVRHRFRDAKPINFGKTKPQDYPVHGVDVSRWQGNIDWATLRAQGANFVYIKATDGGDHLDPMFKKNWRDAADAGMKRGAYHFFYWCRAASEQADWFIRNVPKVEGALPPVIDVEWNHLSNCKKRPSPAVVREKMRVFMERIERHYGQRPVIYTAPDFYKDNLQGAFKDYPFWLRAVAQHPSKVYPGRKWVFWQYSGSGLSQGVNGKIDLNVFHASEAEWRRWVARETRVAGSR